MYNTNLEIADVFRAFEREYYERYGDVMLPSHRKAFCDIIACMTEEMGGHRYKCKGCEETFWAHHGCGNRSCPKCHGRQIVEWLEKRTDELLPCEYFHVIATVPSEVRPVFLANQSVMYALLMQVAARAVIELTKDRRFLGAEPGVLSVLHTWSSRLHYHPHVHMLVTGGGLEEDGQTWRETPSSFLVPVKKLSPLIRRRFQEELKKKHPDLFAQVPKKTWKKQWCSYANSKPVGQGQDAVLKYLARYVFRIAINSNRILHMDKTHVTFRYKENNTGLWKTERIPGIEFIRRFLLHVLPKRFHKVRYFGLWSRGKKARLTTLALELQLMKNSESPVTMGDLAKEALAISELESHGYVPTCPRCGGTDVIHLGKRRRRWRRYVT
jgi:hypothetical protein